jgi:type II secretory pathway component PulF
MTTFNYKAKDRSGKTVTGTVEAATASEAAGMVRELGHLPMDIRAVGARRAESAAPREAGSAFMRYFVFPLWTGVNIRALALFYRQLATMLAAGMTVSEALRSAGSRTRGRLGVLIAEMRDSTLKGGRMSEVISRHPRVFAPLQVHLIRAGEESGTLDGMVDRIATHLEYELTIRRMVSKTLFYPILILLAIMLIPHSPTLIVGGGFLPFVREVWESNRLLIEGLIVALIACKLLLQFKPVRLVWDTVKIVPPVLGTAAHKIAMSRFSKALAILHSAGLPLAQCVSISADACANLAVGEAIRRAIPAIQAGEGLTESLAKTRRVSPMVLDMLVTGERTGSMEIVLSKVSEYMDSEVDATLHKVGLALFVLCILIAGGIVLSMAASSYLGMVRSEMSQ